MRFVLVRHYKVKPIYGLSRGLHVLQTLGEMRAASLHDLHGATGIPKSTLTRILYTCYQQGLVWQRMADGAFLPSHSLQHRAPLDDADRLVEIASPVLAELCQRVLWPSVLAVPRLDYMEIVESNSPWAYFDDVRDYSGQVDVGPIGYRANLLRSSVGRAFLAFCPERERDAVLRRLRERDIPGHELAHDAAFVHRLVATTRARGYSVRAADFGGDYAKTRDEADDGRNSIAMSIRADGRVLGCVNLTWRRTLFGVPQIAERHLRDLRAAVRAVEHRVAQVSGGSGFAPSDGAD